VESKKEKNIIQSLERGLILLETIARYNRPVSLSELDKEFNWDMSTIFRLLATLSKHGYVDVDSDTKKYWLGFKILELSSIIYGSLKVQQIASPLVRELAMRTREASHLAVLNNGEVIIIDQQNSPEMVAVNTHIGMREPLHCTALGKVLFAYLPEDEMKTIFETRGLPALTQNTITKFEVMEKHLQKVRENGYAFDDEEYEIGVRCIGAPVRDHQGQVVAAIGISAPSSRIPYSRVEELAKIVTEIAEKVSHKMGFRLMSSVSMC